MGIRTQARPDLAAIRKLRANATYYVRPDGGDGNSGFADSAAGAFLTLQGAYDSLRRGLDLNGYNLTIQVAPGTYTAGLRIAGAFIGQIGTSTVTFIGDEATPSNVLVSLTSANALRVSRTAITVAGIKWQTTTAGSGFIVQDGGTIMHRNCELGAIADETFSSSEFGLIKATGPTTISGSSESLAHYTGRSKITFEDQTITFLNSPVFSIYKAGGNDASMSLARATIVNGNTITGRVFVHIGATLNLSSMTGDFMGGEPSATLAETGGRIIYEPAQDIVYVDGAASNDFSDGYANTSRRAFKTLAAAMTYLAKRPPDQSQSRVPVIQLAAGTYIPANNLIDIPGVDEVIIKGDETTPGNVIISSGSHCFESDGRSTRWHLRGMTLTSSAASGISCINGGRINFQNLVFGSCSASQISVGRGSQVFSTGVFTVTAGAARFLQCIAGEVAITHTGTWAAGTYAYSSRTLDMDESARVRWTGTKTITGTVTGTRTSVVANSVLNLNGAAQNTIPGNADGTPNTGGIIK